MHSWKPACTHVPLSAVSRFRAQGGRRARVVISDGDQSYRRRAPSPRGKRLSRGRGGSGRGRGLDASLIIIIKNLLETETPAYQHAVGAELRVVFRMWHPLPIYGHRLPNTSRLLRIWRGLVKHSGYGVAGDAFFAKLSRWGQVSNVFSSGGPNSAARQPLIV